MKIKHYKLTLLEKIYFFLIILIILSEFLTQSVSNIFTYADDILIILIILCAFIKVSVQKKNVFLNSEIISLCSLIGIIIIGGLGNLFSGYQENKFAIFIDFLGWQKFFIAYICLLIIIDKEKCNKYIKISERISKIIISIGVILETFNLLNIINLTEGYERFGLNTFSLGGHPSAASAIFATIICLLLYNKKANKNWILVALILEGLTFRFKAIAFDVWVIFCIFFMHKKFSINKAIVAIVLVVCVSWGQIEYYFFSSTASRAVALRTSVQIAKDFFPIGSGFATFGTSMSGKYYSKAYTMYGLSNRWGFTKKHYEFIGDGGIANILAQFGILGSLLYIIVIYMIIKSFQKRCHESNQEILPYLCMLGYLLISASNEGGFNSAYAILMALALSILIKKEKKE